MDCSLVLFFFFFLLFFSFIFLYFMFFVGLGGGMSTSDAFNAYKMYGFVSSAQRGEEARGRGPLLHPDRISINGVSSQGKSGHNQVYGDERQPLLSSDSTSSGGKIVSEVSTDVDKEESSCCCFYWCSW